MTVCFPLPLGRTMELRTHLRPGEERKRKRLQVLTDNRFCCVTLNNLPAVFFQSVSWIFSSTRCLATKKGSVSRESGCGCPLWSFMCRNTCWQSQHPAKYCNNENFISVYPRISKNNLNTKPLFICLYVRFFKNHWTSFIEIWGMLE